MGAPRDISPRQQNSVAELVSLFPSDARHPAPLDLVVDVVARRIADGRHAAGPAESALAALTELQPMRIAMGPHADSKRADGEKAVFVSLEDTARRIEDVLMVDHVFDSEEQMARRAVLMVLLETVAVDVDAIKNADRIKPKPRYMVSVVGWMSGLELARCGYPHAMELLTGDACPQCGINPECHDGNGFSGSTHCLDRTGCAWTAPAR